MHLNRKSQRKKGYDYSQPGYYAITVCMHGRPCLFGMIDDGHMLPNDAGQMVNDTWFEMPQHYPGIEIDQMQMMPYHLHGIIVICEVGAAPRGRPTYRMDNVRDNPNHLVPPSHAAIERTIVFPTVGRARGPAPTGGLSLSTVLERFKSGPIGVIPGIIT